MRPRRGRSSGARVARLHQIGARRPFAARRRIGVQRLGWEARALVLGSELLPEALHERYSSVSGALLERVSAAFDAAAGTREIRVHGDCHMGNLLWNERGPVFVDLDDCAMGVRVQDLWMMLSGSPAEQQGQWQELLEGYQQFADFDFLEVTLIEPLRGAAHGAPRRLAGASLGRPRLPPRLPLGRRAALLGGAPAGPHGADRQYRAAAPAAGLTRRRLEMRIRYVRSAAESRYCAGRPLACDLIPLAHRSYVDESEESRAAAGNRGAPGRLRLG